tara:strand:+ start:282 stop:587 length:306 start_codon:yes stop_codon:yes gene_type:complete
LYHIKKDNARNLFNKKLKIFLEIKNIYATLKTMRQGKKERLKKQALNNIRVRNIRIPTSSIYNNLGLSTYGGMSKRSKFIHIKNNVENNIINRLDKLLKVC